MTRFVSRFVVSLGLLGLALSPAALWAAAQAQLVASGFTKPVFVAAPDGDPRLFVVERDGRIKIVKDGATLPTPFLDLTTRISAGGEGGLLGLAFPADYATSGLFYVYYTDLNHDSVVSRFPVTANPDVADPNHEQMLLFIDQPDGSDFLNHKGGTIAFGPDGLLWFATGDGGSSYDPFENAQNPQSLLGKMLRIDVDTEFAPGTPPIAGVSYLIPADNPFVGSAPRDEIWALGLRNPYRWSFDRGTGDLWIGDVGQGAREEVDVEDATDPGGHDYGWDVMEGTACVTNDPAPSPPCNDPSLTLPVYEYTHAGGECSIIGGYVYRADSSPLAGHYFFGDYCTGHVWSLAPGTLNVIDRTAQLGAAANVGFALVGFGEDGFGRLLLVQGPQGTAGAGKIYRIGSTPPTGTGCGLGPELVPALALLAGLRRARGRSGMRPAPS